MRHPIYPKKPFSTGKRPNGPLMPRCAAPRRNPVQYAPQPDLFGGPDFGQVGDDWRRATPMDLLRSAEASLLTNEEIEEMELLVEEAQEQGNIGPLLAEGISRPLAEALFSGLVKELQDLDEKGFERRAAAFLQYWRDVAASDEEYETEGDGRESIEDAFTGQIEESIEKYVAEFIEYLEDDPLLDQVNEELLTEVLSDPDMYKYEVSQDGGSYTRNKGLWYYDLEEHSGQVDGVRYNEELAAAVGMMIDSDFQSAAEQLEDEGPYYIRFRTRRDEVITRDYFDSSPDYTYSSSARITAYFNHEKVIATLKEKLAEEGLPDRAPDDVVYRYAGTNATVGGASARGMYVIALRPDQLRMEGAALGICVGRTDMGYRESLKKGHIKLYSIRTEAGKPKFTIEVAKDGDIRQIKGKANRLPGFEPGKYDLAKPDEVRLVVEFLLSLGYPPDDIRAANDIRGGVRALEATGVDPFSPPPVRRRELQAPRPNRSKQDAARRMVTEDYAHPWGGQWGA